MNPNEQDRPSFFFHFYRALILPALAIYAIVGYFAVFRELHPLAELEKYSFWARAVGVIFIAPFSFALGFLVMRRSRGNLIGPVIVLWGGVAASELATGFLPPFLAAFSIFYVMVFIFPAFFLMLGVFPTGRGPTPFWDRAIKTAAVVVMFHSALYNLTAPRAYGLLVPSPLAVTALIPWFEELNVVPTYGFTLLLALVLLVLRYRVSDAVQRKQMRWLVLFAGYFSFMIILGPRFYTLLERFFNDLMSLSLMVVPPAVISFAILRHRLWDIDLFIRRTLQYAILSVILGLVYFGGIVILQSAFGGLTGRSDSPLITVITTLAIAALFNPLRLRIQHFIDRRFYRQRFDAVQALDRFALTARDEVDLEKLSGALVDTVKTTMLPTNISLWLQNAPIRRSVSSTNPR